jgi:hypothetical protein
MLNFSQCANESASYEDVLGLPLSTAVSHNDTLYGPMYSVFQTPRNNNNLCRVEDYIVRSKRPACYHSW